MNKFSLLKCLRKDILLVSFATMLLALACKSNSELKANNTDGVAYAQAKSQGSPCKEGQPSLSDEELRKNYQLENYGYSSEISLEVAIDNFNHHAICTPNPRIIPLNVEEVIAAIRYVSPDTARPPSWVKEQLEKIATERKMPKGSLFKVEHGYKQPSGYDLDYWFIDLYLGLDKSPIFEVANPKYFRLMIRRQFLTATLNSKNKSN